MNLPQTYLSFSKAIHLYASLIKNSLLNRVFKLHPQLMIFEHFHEEKGLWHAIFIFQPNLSGFFVSFDPKIPILLGLLGERLETTLDQSKLLNLTLDEQFPKIIMLFQSLHHHHSEVFFHAHPTRPVFQISHDQAILFSSEFRVKPQDKLLGKSINLFDKPFRNETRENENLEGFWPLLYSIVAKPFDVTLTNVIQAKKQKILVYEKDKKMHEQKDLFRRLADYLLTLNLPKMGMDSIEFEETILPIKRHESSGQNAALYYKKSKKASKGLVQVAFQQQKNLEEITQYEEKLALLRIPFLENIKTIRAFLIDKRIIGSNQKTTDMQENIPNENPYFMWIDGVKFSFGKNENQNDQVTFHLAQKKEFFFHIAKQSGSHVIMHHPQPNEKQLLLGAMITVLLNKQTDGEVHFSPVKFVKKTPSKGLVKLEKYESIRVKVTRAELKKYIEDAKRY